MKKIVTLTMVALLLLGMFNFNVSAQDNPSVILNGTMLEFDVPPQIINGRTLVPFRTIFETLGYEVFWDDAQQVAMGAHVGNDLIVGFKIGYPATFSAKVSDSKNLKETPIDVPAQVVNGRTMIPLRALSDSIGADVQWDGTTSTVYITYDDGSKLETIDDIESYLNAQYSMIKVGNEIYPIRYSVMTNVMDIFQWDINITPTIGLANEILLPLQVELTTTTNEDKQIIVDSIREFMEPLAKDVISHFPNKKIFCYFDNGYYKYPNIKVDWVSRNYFSWSNYEYDLLGKNKTTKPEEFRWVYEHDTGGRLDFNDYFSDVEINTPATIEDYFDNFVVRSLEYKGNTSLNNEGTEVNVTYEATSNGTGFAYLNLYDKDDKLLSSEINYFYSGTKDYTGHWPLETAKIVISADADINYERNNEIDFTSNVPFEIPAEYSFEEDFEIIDCYFVDCGVSLLDDCCSYTFIIDANGSDYVYVNFFDEDGYYLDSSYENIRDGKHEYIMFNMPEGATHIEFSEKKTTKMSK